jgi:hypothetical protein
VVWSAAQVDAHPDAVLHLGNPIFALFLIAILLPLQSLLDLRTFVRVAKARPAWWLVPIVTFALFATLFTVDHPYNRVALEVNLRNAWLVRVQSDPWVWSGFGLTATLAASSFGVSLLARPQAWLLAPFALVFLASAWLIEPRYSLIPLTLYLCLRRPGPAWVESITLALWSAAAVYLAIGFFDFRLII